MRQYSRLAPVTAVALELAKFDVHGLSAPEVAEQGGVAYQKGELASYEVREYLLEVEHIVRSLVAALIACRI